MQAEGGGGTSFIIPFGHLFRRHCSRSDHSLMNRSWTLRQGNGGRKCKSPQDTNRTKTTDSLGTFKSEFLGSCRGLIEPSLISNSVSKLVSEQDPYTMDRHGGGGVGGRCGSDRDTCIPAYCSPQTNQGNLVPRSAKINTPSPTGPTTSLVIRSIRYMCVHKSHEPSHKGLRWCHEPYPLTRKGFRFRFRGRVAAFVWPTMSVSVPDIPQSFSHDSLSHSFDRLQATDYRGGETGYV